MTKNIWNKLFKNGPSKICEIQPLNNLLKQTISLQSFKGCILQILLGHSWINCVSKLWLCRESNLTDQRLSKYLGKCEKITWQISWKLTLNKKNEVKIFLNNINKPCSLNKYHILLSFLILRKDYIQTYLEKISCWVTFLKKAVLMRPKNKVLLPHLPCFSILYKYWPVHCI